MFRLSVEKGIPSIAAAYGAGWCESWHKWIQRVFFVLFFGSPMCSNTGSGEDTELLLESFALLEFLIPLERPGFMSSHLGTNSGMYAHRCQSVELDDFGCCKSRTIYMTLLCSCSVVLGGGLGISFRDDKLGENIQASPRHDALRWHIGMSADLK